MCLPSTYLSSSLIPFTYILQYIRPSWLYNKHECKYASVLVDMDASRSISAERGAGFASTSRLADLLALETPYSADQVRFRFVMIKLIIN